MHSGQGIMLSPPVFSFPQPVLPITDYRYLHNYYNLPIIVKKILTGRNHTPII
jgi:hypothetical protein